MGDPDRWKAEDIARDEFNKFRKSDTGKRVEQTCMSLWSGYPYQYARECYNNPGTSNLKKWSDGEHKFEHWLKDNRDEYLVTHHIAESARADVDWFLRRSHTAQGNRARACHNGILDMDGSNCDFEADRYNTGASPWWFTGV